MTRALILFLAATAAADGLPADLDARLAELAEKLEAERRLQHIPGMALAVVAPDTVLATFYFGLADAERGRPVGESTVFAIGSTTKAFTSALCALLVEEDRMRWDAPAALWLPELDLRVRGLPWLVRMLRGRWVVTIRDLLSHRTGFARNDLLWYGGFRTPEQLLADASGAEPFAGFRTAFLYNNVQFLAAGMAAGRAAGSDWHRLVRERLLVPLGMAGTTTTLEEARGRLAQGYLWDKEADELQPLPPRNLDAIGPAGSLNSSAADMARWLRFLLARGEIDGERLVSAEVLGETFRPQIAMGDGRDYGLGWMLGRWRGERLVEHGGNIDGFAAEVAFLPERGLGFVLLTNISFAPLQQASPALVFEALLGEPEDRPTVPLDGLPGRYRADFGQLRDTWLTVLEREGKLAIDVPGQTVYELLWPGEDGRWGFAVAPQAIQISFRREGGQVVSLFLHQGGFDFECPREGVELPVEEPLDRLGPLLGRYRLVVPGREEPVVFQALLHNNRLAVDIPEEMAYELLPPDSAGFRAFRVRPSLAAVRFVSGDSGNIVRMEFRGAQGTAFLDRLADAPAEPLPSSAEIEALIRKGYGDPASLPATLRLEGTIRFVHQGVSGRFVQVSDGEGRVRTSLDLAPWGWMDAGWDGESGWSSSAFQLFQLLRPREAASVRRGHPFSLLRRGPEEALSLVGRSTHEGRPTLKVEVGGEGLPKRLLMLDAETGRILGERTAEVQRGIGEVPVETRFLDWRDIGGVWLPFEARGEGPTGETVLVIERATAGEPLGAEAFVPRR